MNNSTPGFFLNSTLLPYFYFFLNILCIPRNAKILCWEMESDLLGSHFSLLSHLWSCVSVSLGVLFLTQWGGWFHQRQWNVSTSAKINLRMEQLRLEILIHCKDQGLSLTQVQVLQLPSLLPCTFSQRHTVTISKSLPSMTSKPLPRTSAGPWWSVKVDLVVCFVASFRTLKILVRRLI